MSATTNGSTDMNQILRRRPPAPESEAEAEAATPAVPSFDGGARDAPAAGTDMNKIIRRQLRGRG